MNKNKIPDYVSLFKTINVYMLFVLTVLNIGRIFNV